MTARPNSARNIQSCLVFLITACLSVGSATAQEPHSSKDQTDVHSVSTDMVPIMALLMNHDHIRFTIQDLPNGARTTTTSKNPEIVTAIRLHAREMQARVQQGNNIRLKDPIFIEIFRHHNEISDKINDIPGGVSEDETSPNPQVVLLIRAHAKTVAGFVRDGLPATHQNTPLPKGYHPDAG